jgi:hypothetical protein
VASHDAWVAALDRLELDALRAERLLADPTCDGVPDPWEVPSLAGPIPADLVARAVELRARQQRVEGALVTAVSAARRQHQFADRVGQAATRRTDRPVYLDINA